MLETELGKRIDTVLGDSSALREEDMRAEALVFAGAFALPLLLLLPTTLSFYKTWCETSIY